MAVTVAVYGKLQQSLWEGRINFATDTIKAMLLQSYTVGSTQDTAQFLSDVVTAGVGVEATGGGSTGYTAGGQALTGKVLSYTAANSWSTQRANSTAYTLGDVVRPASANGYVYQCIVAGTSGGSVPTYPTVIGQTVTDGGVTWACVGRGVLLLRSADPSWTTGNPGTLSASHIVFYKDTGTPSTSPVILYWDLGGSQVASNGGAFTAQEDAGEGLLVSFTG
ncbi:hypothetical protein OG320_05170 [Microbispora sp. NBC_01189]|uniref:hypothetical protein n=1 Tax=Microbispora sp. NBC_01189 TaxID=2903583 RepID=UPI002E11124A|nr:hypothetical protein OG320_05170 [Microbispora sp. NBC_01189]